MILPEIDKLLPQLGITSKYKAYQPLRIILQLIVDDPDRLEYPLIGTLRGAGIILNSSLKSIQSHLRSLIHSIWIKNSDPMKRLSKYPQTENPTTIQFIDVLAIYLLRDMHIE